MHSLSEGVPVHCIRNLFGYMGTARFHAISLDAIFTGAHPPSLLAQLFIDEAATGPRFSKVLSLLIHLLAILNHQLSPTTQKPHPRSPRWLPLSPPCCLKIHQQSAHIPDHSFLPNMGERYFFSDHSILVLRSLTGTRALNARDSRRYPGREFLNAGRVKRLTELGPKYFPGYNLGKMMLL